MPKCDRCGRYHAGLSGSAWMMVYDGALIPTPDHEITRCVACVDKFGPFKAQLGIRDEFSCGVIAADALLAALEGRGDE